MYVYTYTYMYTHLLMIYSCVLFVYLLVYTCLHVFYSILDWNLARNFFLGFESTQIARQVKQERVHVEVQ